MNRLQVIALVGLTVLEACSAADDVSERPIDAGRDVKTIARPDASFADRLDAGSAGEGGTGGDVDAGLPPRDPDAETPDTTLPPPDVAPPPPDTPSSDVGPPLDRNPPRDSPLLPDAAADTAASCLVTFTVKGVHWDAPEGGADAQGGTRVVRLVGDAANIGSWTPTAGVLLVETGPGTWSGTATFRDQQLTEFKFVKLDGITPEWESWTPYDSNRSLRVECFGDGGAPVDAADAGSGDATAIDAAADRTADGNAQPMDAAGDAATGDVASDGIGPAEAGAADATPGGPDGAAGDARIFPVPARGKNYVGTFGVRPADATK